MADVQQAACGVSLFPQEQYAELSEFYVSRANLAVRVQVLGVQRDWHTRAARDLQEQINQILSEVAQGIPPVQE